MLRKVLIVEDSEVNRRMLRAILHAEYDVLEAVNGEEALAILHKKHKIISAVLLDIVMPVLDGFEVLKAMRNNAVLSQIPVIVATGSADEDAEVKALSLGANDFVKKPYNPALISHCLRNTINLRETASIVNAIQRDKLTGLYNREAFFSKVEAALRERKPGECIMSCFDIDSFKVINDQYGAEEGDRILRHVGRAAEECFTSIGGICGRISADNFAALYPAGEKEVDFVSRTRDNRFIPPGTRAAIAFSVGRYVVTDLSLSASAIYDRAYLAKQSVKGRYDEHIAYFSESMREKLIRDQEIIGDMDAALEANQFEVWLQPQFNHASGALIGAEALVRWRHPQKGLIPPYRFIPVFEQNGFIYEMDKYVWEQACRLLRGWIDQGRAPLPISVNVSRYDVFREDFFPFLTGLVEKYKLPTDLLRLEITESAFAKSAEQIIAMVKRLIEYGFTIEIDDFGSGYSSLNTLKDVPATVLKLDVKFFEATGDSQRGGNIVESVVRMAKWLGMSVVAEGVESRAQADYLKSIGCYYVQGYLYAKPMPVADYEALAANASKEQRLLTLETVENLDNNAFWDPKSMDTLIFNSYVGGACIFEYHNGTIELLRANDKYAQVIGSAGMTVEVALKLDWSEHLDEDGLNAVQTALRLSIDTGDSVTREFLFRRLPGCPEETWLRSTIRVIASSGDHYLVYCTNENITAQRQAEKKEHQTAEHMQAIMDNIKGGVSAAVVRDGVPSILFANEQFFAQRGYTRAQYVSEVGSVYDVIHPEDRPAFEKRAREADESRAPFTAIYRVVRRDGGVRWLQSSISITTFADLRDPVQLSVANDITDLRDAEERARAASEQVRAIMDDVGSGITATSLEGDGVRFLLANDKYYEILGYTRAQYQAEVKDAYGNIHPDDRARVARMALDAYRTDTPAQTEYRVLRRDGATRWVRAVLSSTRFAGVEHPVQLGVFSDVTQEKAAQQELYETDEQLRFLNETAHDLLAQPDSEKGLLDVLFKLLRYFRGNRAYIFELDRVRRVARNTYEACAQGVTSEKDNLQAVPFSACQFWLHAFDQKRYVDIGDVDALDESRATEKATLKAQGIRSLLAVPLERDGVLIGFIGVDDPSGPRPRIDRMVALGDYIAVMLTRRDLERKIASDSDTLTELMSGIPGGFVRMLAREDGSVVPVYFNDGFCSLVSMSVQELFALYGEDSLAGVHPDDKPAVREAIRRMLESGEARIPRYRLRSGQGGYIWVMIVGRATRKRTGETYLNVYYNAASAPDEDDGSAARLLADSMPGGLARYECSPGRIRILYFNDGFCRLFGFTREEYEKRSAADPTGCVFAEDLPDLLSQVDSLVRTGAPIECRYRARVHGGGYKWISHRAVAGERNGESVIVSAVLMDVTAQQEAIERLRVSEEEHRLAVRHSGTILCRYSATDRSLVLSPEGAAFLGLPERLEDVPEGPVRRGWISPESAEAYSRLFLGVLGGAESGEAVFQAKTPGGWRSVRARSSTIFSADGKPVSAVVSFRDETEQLEKETVYKKWQQSLKDKDPASYTLYRCNLSKDAPFDAVEGELLRFPFPPDERSLDARARLYAEKRVVEEDREAYLAFVRADALLAAYRRGDRSRSLEYRETAPDGQERWLRLSVDLVEYPGSADVEAYLMYENIDAGKREELLNRERAETDPLTGILNRAAFAEKADGILRASAPGARHALLMLDIDGFKLVNDAFGHATGDQALIDTASAMRSVLRRSDLLGRLGGDEFVTFLPDIPNDAAALGKARRMCAAVRRSYSLEVQISGSIGVVVSPRDGVSFEALYKRADEALYHVKGSGKDDCALYRDDMAQEHMEPKPEPRGAVPAEKKRRMLIVDDNLMDHQMLSHLFEDEFIIEKAKDGASAVIRLRHYGTAISVVLLDLMMPGMDGFAVLQRMRGSEEMRSIPVVVVSGDDNPETSLRAIRAGASDFVTKPVDSDLLRIRVRSAISKAENERLRAQNSLLEIQSGELGKYRAVLEGTGTVLVEYDWLRGEFAYDPAISERIAGVWDQRKLWRILLSDMVADVATVKRMQEFVHAIAEDRGRSTGGITVQMKTPSREAHSFRMNVYKRANDYRLTEKLVIAFRDVFLFPPDAG